MRTLEAIAKPAGLSASDVLRILIRREAEQGVVQAALAECVDRGDPVPEVKR